MNKATKGAVAVAALATTVQAATKQARKVIAPHDPPGWGRNGSTRRAHVVTVYRPQDQVAPGGVAPAPLRELPGVTIEYRPAPGNQGTEVWVTGDDHDAIRLALRHTKMLIEAGEIVQPTRPGTIQETPLNAPLRAATGHAQEGGRL